MRVEVADNSDLALESDTAFIDPKDCSTEMHIPLEDETILENIDEKSSINLNEPTNDTESEFLI